MLEYSHLKEDALDIIAETITSLCSKGDIVLLVGEMGSGKTTLISRCVHLLGCTQEASSPTFALIQQYPLERDERGITHVNHIDTYRLHSVNELFELGIENLSSDDGLTFIEWGERIEEFIDMPYLCLSISEDDDETRSFSLEFSKQFDYDRCQVFIEECKKMGWQEA